MKKLKKYLLTLSAVTAFLLTAAFSTKTANATVIVLDPGHGGNGVTSSQTGCNYAPYYEKDMTLQIATQIKNDLSAAGYTVYMTRTGDTSLDLAQRAAYAKSVGGNLLISIHCNACGSHTLAGAEVWTSAYGTYNTVGKGLGNQILASLSSVGLGSRGVKTKIGDRGDYYGIIRESLNNGIPAIILEQAYIDNETDRAVIASQGVNGLADADAKGIIAYLNNTPLPTSYSTGGAPIAYTVTAAPTPVKALINGQTVIVYPFTDKNGTKANFTQTQWNYFVSLWIYTGDPVHWINQQTVGDLTAIYKSTH